MSIANATEDAILKLVFQAVAWTAYAINHTTTPETNIIVGLHTADPADAGTMATSEAAYTSYARASVARTAGGWGVTGTAPCEAKPVANIDFAAGTGGGESVTFFSTGKSGGGAAAILWSGAVSPAITTGSGITPRLTTATSIQLDAHWLATAAVVLFLLLSGGTGIWPESPENPQSVISKSLTTI